jgi:hypothetical protein
LVALTTTGRVSAEDIMTRQGFGPCDGDRTVSIETLYSACGAPGDCSKPLPCEQVHCRIQGIVSRVNIWDRRTHPWLPSSKLLIESPDSSLNLEVQLIDAVAPRILDRLQSPPSGWDGSIVISGQVIGVDLPMQRACRRALILIVSDADALSFDIDSSPTPDPR